MPAKPYRIEEHPDYGFLQVKPTPTREECAEYYAKEFYSSAYPGFQNSALDVQLADEEYLDGHREDICQSLSALLGRPAAGMEVLDIGCGWAQALLYFKKQGMACYGFDPAPEAVAYSRQQGLEVVQADIDQMDAFPERRFDVATLFNVLEHLTDPIKSLEAVRDKVLKPGGVLVIEVPNDFNPFQLAATELHDLKQWWVAPPAHLNYFSPATLRRLLAGLGFTVAHVESTFPLDMFLLFGDNYVQDRSLGKACHQRRVAFELNLRKLGKTAVLRDLYRSLATMQLGRTVVAFAQTRHR
jgi:SAM-dependent methyltransferase